MITLLLNSIDNPDDREKLELIYENNRTKMIKYAISRLKNQHDAEDAVSNAFLRIAKCIHRIETEDATKLEIFVITIVKNECLRLIEKKQKILTYKEIEFFDDSEPQDSISEMIEIKENYDKVVKAIANLPDPYAVTMRLRFIFDFSIAEISDITGENKGTVKSRISRGKQKIASIIKEIE